MTVAHACRWDIWRLDDRHSKENYVVLSPDPILAAGGNLVCCPIGDQYVGEFTVQIQDKVGDYSPAFAIVPQLETFSPSQLQRKVGRLNHQEIAAVETALREYFLLF